MRTLYVRIVVMTMFIMVISALIAFVVTNIYYQGYLKPENDKKITSIAEDIVTVYEESSDQSITSYLKSMANLGYQFYLIDQYGNERQFGEPFRVKNLDDHEIDIVLSGDIYHGIANFPWRPFITGFFDNELANTVGVPIKIDDQVKALFVRPDTVKQFGEMRIFLTIMLIFILLFSFILVAISTSFIVNPIKKLTEATRKIAAGNYHIQLNNDRYDEIGRLSRDFTKMSNQLREIEKKRQEFVSSVSHEIQSPLTSIQGFSQALREQNLSEQEQDHYLSIIEDESRRLSDLSEQLLTLSFLDSDLDIDKQTSYNLVNQLTEIISSMKWQRLEKNIAIELDAKSVKIFGDRELLHQVWVNLLKNAINYNVNGGTVTVQVINHHDTIDVLFKDTGIGMSSVDVNQIFNRFYKADKARTRTEKSTGLGLSIVKKIIELHHGTIMVDSKLGKGSTFKVSLPKEGL